jgi:hypothetical protein
VSVCFCLFLSVSACVCVCVCVYLSICLSVCLSIWMGLPRSSTKLSYPLGLAQSSLANYGDRLIPQQLERHHQWQEQEVEGGALSLFSLPFRLVQQLYASATSSSSSSGGGGGGEGKEGKEGAGAGASTLPQYCYDRASRHISLHDASTPLPPPSSSSPPPLLLSLPALHALTAPLVERSAALLNLLLQNRQGAHTLPVTSEERGRGGGGGRRGGYVNPFQQSLALLHDEELACSLSLQEGGGGEGGQEGG